MVWYARKCICDLTHFVGRIPGGERNHGWNLEQTDLQGIGRTNLNTGEEGKLVRDEGRQTGQSVP